MSRDMSREEKTDSGGDEQERGGPRRRFLLGLLAMPGLVAGGLTRPSPALERTATLSLREADYYRPRRG